MTISKSDIKLLKSVKKIVDYLLSEFEKEKEKGDKKMELDKFLNPIKVKEIMEKFNVNFFEAKILFVLGKMGNIGISSNAMVRLARMGKGYVYKFSKTLEEKGFIYRKKRGKGKSLFLKDDIYEQIKRILKSR